MVVCVRALRARTWLLSARYSCTRTDSVACCCLIITYLTGPRGFASLRSRAASLASVVWAVALHGRSVDITMIVPSRPSASPRRRGAGGKCDSPDAVSGTAAAELAPYSAVVQVSPAAHNQILRTHNIGESNRHLRRLGSTRYMYCTATLQLDAESFCATRAADSPRPPGGALKSRNGAAPTV